MWKQLEPKAVFRWFAWVSRFPHGSGHTEQLAEACLAFARERKLACRRDAIGNVVICKPGRGSSQSAAPLILQAHLDMVLAAAPESGRDLLAEGPRLQTDGEWVWAEGTTLGADDGIGVAVCLALLDDPTLEHPPLEIVLTVDEETGMKGALALDCAGLQGRHMINLDAEQEGIIYVGCAGGNKVSCVLPVRRIFTSGRGWELRISGLRGGHSGMDIHRGRASAARLIGRTLFRLSRETALYAAEAELGQADNAIAAEGTVRFLLPEQADPTAEVQKLEACFRSEYAAADPELRLVLEPWRPDGPVLDRDSTNRLITLLVCGVQGVEEMSQAVPGLPQTSGNLGLLRVTDREIRGEFCIRSAFDSQKTMLNERLACLAAALGGRAAYSEGCPAWEYRAESPLRVCCEKAYEALYEKKPISRMIHAGAECGVFAAAIPELDCISIGPEIRGAHTPAERMRVESVRRTWTWLLEILRRL